VERYVSRKYGSDTGTKTTWKQALKVYALAFKRLNVLPVFMAHCYMSGKRYAEAATMYGELYDLVDTQVNDADVARTYGGYDFVPTLQEEKDWLHSYLAYCAGNAYAQLGDLKRAKTWYSRSAEFVGHPDGGATVYYAKESAKRLKELRRKSSGRAPQRNRGATR
jgi:tetratricopeptide (TPR) repeat protein